MNKDNPIRVSASWHWFKYASPHSFHPLAGRLTFPFGALAVLFALAGLYVGFFVAPTDAQQGEAYRIIFIHVPAAWMSMFLYFGFMALHAAIDEPRRADRACALLALVGVTNVPIIYFSVTWWNTLHQGASVSLRSAPTMALPMLLGMLLLALSFWMYSIAMTLARVRCEIVEREFLGKWPNQQAVGMA